jgi:hypothetical protein
MKAMQSWTGPALVAVAILTAGCAGPGRPTRWGATRLNLADVELTRADVVVLQPVVGQSNEQKFLLGLVTIVDGHKVEVLGFPFFKDQTARLQGMRGYLPCGTKLESRAYYKALAAAPEADAIVERSVSTERFVLPVLYSCKTLTYQGKAVKLKPE